MSRSTQLLILVLTGLALFLGGYFKGKADTENANDAKKLRTVEKVIERHDVAAVVGHGVEKAAVVAEARQEAHTRKLTQEAHADVKTNPSPAACRLDDQRLRRWLDANRGATPDPTGAPDGAAAGDTTAAGERSPGRSGSESHRDSGDLPPGAGALQSAGGVAGAHE